ncbi:exonuclease-like protein [Lasiosphaeria ovina]|uniref:Exonuclease-like protein n=1 Tax=Lasiosphaeria ovina TaxID=92902 RepID=A0AAE0JX00_9PEZI|nr:exonuclease-like protein [Lasiosphaeria ovina]
MEGSNVSLSHKVWHQSRGIVFASGTGSVVYPRLPPASYHTSPAFVQHKADSSASSAGNAPDAHVDGGRVARETADKDRPTEPLTEDGTEKVESSASGLVDAADVQPPFTPLDFKIPDEIFRGAKQAAEGTPESFWSYSLYRGPADAGSTEPGLKVKVHYCTSKHTTERVLQQYFMHEKILGFDLEWATDATKFQGARRNVCLVQIASPSRIALFHLALYPKNDDLVAPSFKKIMEDPEVTKVGVWIKGDCTRLRRFLDIDSRGIFELSHLYRLIKCSASGEYGSLNKKLVGLASQVQEYLRLPLFKGHDVRASDWSSPLRMEQIIYSASDAYAAVQLYAIMDHHRKNLDPVPPMPYHAELNLPIRIASGVDLPTADEVLEQEAEDGAAARDGPVLSDKYLTYFGDSINIEVENDASAGIDESSTAMVSAKDAASAPSTPAVASKKPTAALTATTTTLGDKTRPKDARLAEAELWTSQYRLANPKARAAPSSLRAYYVWRKNAGLTPEQTAAVLRDPPLQFSTVTSYITDAIRLEKLPYDKARLRNEVLDRLPKESLASWRLRGLVQACAHAGGGRNYNANTTKRGEE